ncbi:T9SS type A sorting domain-containing protein [bacterium]|nr:T9SS type A sorting domain-containing protein [bacterium]
MSHRVCFLLALVVSIVPVFAQPLIMNITAPTSAGDSVFFRVQIPSNYSALRPPAILVGWHALGGTEHEIFDRDFDEECEVRGWIIASHMGPNDRHWNTRLPQLHCRAMLEWIEERYPFSRDSIYMAGGSMGAAAGQVWHNNNCAWDDYLIAATAGGSQILDCQLRQEQYLASGDTNRSMRAAFGGFPFESDSVAYEYHRYSAVHFADTTESMHFNALTIPVWSTWGAEEFEWNAYGYAAQDYAILRQGAAESHFNVAPIAGHGFPLMWAPGVCEWFAQYGARRFPDTLAIAADEDGSYFFCNVELADRAYMFARADVRKSADQKRVDVTLIQNVALLDVQFVFPWRELDTLRGTWTNLDSSVSAIMRLSKLPPRVTVTINGDSSATTREGTLDLPLFDEMEIEIIFGEPLPREMFDFRVALAYPNPFNSSVTLLLESSAPAKTEFSLYNMLGQQVYADRVDVPGGTSSIRLSLDELAAGVYFARLGHHSKPFKLVLIP